MTLLIHGAPGSRLGFLNAFLTNSLESNSFDVGHTVPFCKLHTFDANVVEKFTGKKIYIKLSTDLLWLHLVLFFEKNVKKIKKEFRELDYTHRTLFDKFYYSSNAWYQDEAVTNLDLYDFVVPFDQTYNIEYLVNLYQQINGTAPSRELLCAVASTNQLNQLDVPDNHTARVAAAVFNFEHQQGLNELDRLWALNDKAPFDHISGECLEPTMLYANIVSQLTYNNYR